MTERTRSLAGIDSYHLQIELQRVDLRLQRAVQLWQLAGQNPDDAFRGLYVSDDEANALLARPVSANWGQTATLPAEATQALERNAARIQTESSAILDEATKQRHRLPLVHLVQAFGLSRFEIDVLLLCIAPSVDLRYERIYGYLQDDVTKKRPTVNLALDLLAEPGIGRLSLLAVFNRDAPLVRHRLIELVPPADGAPTSGEEAPLLAHTLQIDEGLLSWLMGSYRPHAMLIGYLSYTRAPDTIPDAFVNPEITQALVQGTEPAIYLFHGPDEDLKRGAAALLAQSTGQPLLMVDLAGLTEKRKIDPQRAVQTVLRDARLLDAIPVLGGWDVCLVNDTTPPALLHELSAFPGPIVLAGQRLWHPQGSPRSRRLLQVAFPVPAYPQRRLLWRHFAGFGEAESSLDAALDALAGQFALSSGQIRDAVATARDYAVAHGIGAQKGVADDAAGGEATTSSGAALSAEWLFAAARAHSNPRLAQLASKITPRYSWEDIVLPEDQLALLHEIIDTVRGRPQVLDVWGLGAKLTSSRGVTLLFSGPPGTGKTMAAQIIAGALGLDIYRIDLSTIVSKYIGETEKNIERIFREAEQSNAILFFDEADALFGKRSEVRDSHDRYANIEVSYLLQRMEAYDGITILATNLRGNLDEAFTRRLQFAVSFPFPESEDRLLIWQTLFPPDIPRTPDIDLAYLAERFRLAGGNIRNIIVSAAYLAAADGDSIAMSHLLHGTRRELQKMGRLVREEDMVVGAGSREPQRQEQPYG